MALLSILVLFRSETDLSQARDTNMNYLSMNRITRYALRPAPVRTSERGLQKAELEQKINK